MQTRRWPGCSTVRDKAPYVQLYFDTAFGASVGGAMNDEIALLFAGKASPQDVVDATQRPPTRRSERTVAEKGAISSVAGGTSPQPGAVTRRADARAPVRPCDAGVGPADVAAAAGDRCSSSPRPWR